jgi:hypothetical protein
LRVYSVRRLILRCYPLPSPRVFPDHRGKALATPCQRQVMTLSPLLVLNSSRRDSTYRTRPAQHNIHQLFSPIDSFRLLKIKQHEI